MSSYHLRELTRLKTVTSMDFHPTELIIAVSVFNYFTKLLRLLPDGTIDETPIETLSDIGSKVAFHPSGQFLATCDFSKKNSEVILWQVLPNSPSGNIMSYFIGHDEYINSIAFDPTGHFFATGSYNKARVWQVRTDGTPATCLAELTDHNDTVISVAFSSTGRFLATGGFDKTVKLWCKAPDDDTNWTCIASLNQSEPLDVVSNMPIAFHPTLPLLAVGLCNGTVTLWQKQTHDDTKWTCVGTFLGHSDAVFSLAFYPDGVFLATGGSEEDKTLKIWMLTNDKSVAKCVDTLFFRDMVVQIRFHSSGKFMAVETSAATFILYDTSVLLIQKKTELLATQGTARLLAQRLSTDPTSTDKGLHIRREQKITREVDAANQSLHLALLNSRDAQEKAKDNLEKQNQSGRGGRISRKKRKINKRNSYRK
jgi:WD40 repeat protein